MNNFNTDNDPLKDLMKKHKVRKAPEGFTNKVMDMVKSGVILEEDTEPLIATKYLVAAAVGFIGLLLASFVFDISFFNTESIKGFINSQQLAGLFSSYQSLSDSFSALFENLFGNNIFIISILTIALLVGLDKIFRKKVNHHATIVL
jgi:hypothetical protein